MQDDKKQSSLIIHKYVPAALLVILFYFLINRFTGFLSIVSAFLNILQPVFVGMATAFLANPVMMFFDRLLAKFLIRSGEKPNRWKLRRRKEFIRGVSAVLGVAFLVAIVAAFAVQHRPAGADAWTTLATGETIGRRRYLDLPAAPRGGTLRLRAEASLDTPRIASFRALRLLPEASAGRGRTPARGCAADGVDCVRLRIDTSGRNI